MSSDEDDYMSAAFIVTSSDNDVRPGLLHNHDQRRSLEIFKKKQAQDVRTKETNKPIRVIEAERREEGLQEAIGAGNKGFSLLQKMGYKPGTAIGKSGTGTIDPIPLQLKTDRQGLGRAAAMEELKKAKRLIRVKRGESKKEEVSVELFRARLSQKSLERFIEIDLSKSQKACYNLDAQEGFVEPAEPWFWPKHVIKNSNDKSIEIAEDPSSESPAAPVQSKEEKSPGACESDSEEDEDDFEISEKLELLTKYLRCTFNYCIWCSVKFDDEKDMQSDCPGPTRSDH